MTTPDPDWMLRAVASTRGNQSKLGALLLAVLKKRPKSGRNMYGPEALITPTGQVISCFTNRWGTFQNPFLVCDVDDLRRNFEGLAEACKMTEEEAQHLFRMLREWIKTDLRPGGTDLHGKFEYLKKVQ